MITKEVTICGKQVMLAYCYATEISYKVLTDENIDVFMGEVGVAIADKTMPDVKKSIMLILASMMSYYEFKDENAPITDKELMANTTPSELGNAVGVIVGLHSLFYYVPKDEKDKANEEKTEKTDDEPKNA